MSEDQSGASPESEEEHRPTPVRVRCECGGVLGLVMLPSDEQVFHAVCPACGTRYRRTLMQLTALAEHGADPTLVILPRARPRG